MPPEIALFLLDPHPKMPNMGKAEVQVALTPIAAGLRHRKSGVSSGQPELVHAAAIQANKRIILVAML
jgi:hypothetical protein